MLSNLIVLEYKNPLLTFSEPLNHPTIKDYEGVWIQEENGKPVALITAERRSYTKLTCTILSYSLEKLGPISKSFSFENHYITIDDSTIDISGTLKPDGIVSWSWQMGIRTWRRPNAFDYIGDWIAKTEDAVFPIECEQFYVKQFLFISLIHRIYFEPKVHYFYKLYLL